MAPPKKNIKMDLSAFLSDETLGGSAWTEQEVDLNKIKIQLESTDSPSSKSATSSSAAAGAGASNGGPNLESFLQGRGGSSLDPAMGGSGSMSSSSGFPRKERIVYEVPDFGPFRARIVNFPLDVTENGIKLWFEDGLAKQGAVSEVFIPTNMDGTPKKFAFVTLNSKEDLITSLTFNGNQLNARTVYVEVAPPQRTRDREQANVNWGSARGANFGSIPDREQREPREQANVNWGGARGANFGSIPDREYREQREPREQPNVNWGGARGSNFGSIPDREPREHREPREQPNVNWGGARGSNFGSIPDREPREHREPREQPNVNWGSARGANFGSIPDREPREQREPREPREQPTVNWGGARGANFGSIPDREPREHREPREPREHKDQPNVNWGAARGANFGSIPDRQPREHREPRESKQQEPKLNWGAARNSATAAPAASEEVPAEEKASKLSSSFAVLSVDDEDEETPKAQPTATEKKQTEATVSASSNVDEDGWEVSK